MDILLKDIYEEDKKKILYYFKIKSLEGIEDYLGALNLIIKHFPSPETLSFKIMKRIFLDLYLVKINCLICLGRFFEARDIIENLVTKISKERKILTINSLEIIITNENLMELLNHRGVIYWYIDEYSKALKYLNELLKLAKENNNNTKIITSYNNLGLIYHYSLGDLDKALDCYLKAEKHLSLEKNKNSFFHATILNNIGNNYLDRGEYLIANKTYHDSLVIAEDSKIPATIARVKNNLGNINILIGELENALEFSLQSLKIRREKGLKDDYSISLTNVGKLYYYMAEYDLSEAYLLKSLEVNKEIKVESRNSECLYLLILVTLEKDEYQLAENYLLDLEKLSQMEYINQDIRNTFKLSKAIILKNKNNFRDKAKAMEILRDLSKSQNINFNLLKEIYLNLSEILLTELTVYKNQDTLSELESILELLLNAAKKQKNTRMFVLVNQLKARLHMFNMKYEEAEKLLIYIQKLAEDKGMWRIAISIVKEISDIGEQKEKYNNLDKIESNLVERLELSQLEVLLNRTIRNKVEDTKQLKKYAIDYIHTSIFNSKNTTRPIASEEPMKIEKNIFNEIMAKVGTYYNVTLTQGGETSLGLYGPLPVPVLSDFMGLAFSYQKINSAESKVDEDYKDYYFIVFIIPKSLKFIFEDREGINSKLEEFISKQSEKTQYDLYFLNSIKKILIE